MPGFANVCEVDTDLPLDADESEGFWWKLLVLEADCVESLGFLALLPSTSLSVAASLLVEADINAGPGLAK